MRRRKECSEIAQKVVTHSQSQVVGQMFVVGLFVVRIIVVQHIVVKRVLVLWSVVGSLVNQFVV